jgi:phosphoribosylformylglycinamidine synthase
MSLTEVLYSESASRLLVTVPAADVAVFEQRFAGQFVGRIGTVSESGELVVTHEGQTLVRARLEAMTKAFKATLDW